MKIVEKGYELNLDKVYRGFRFGEVIVQAESRGKAKSKIWEELKYNIPLNWNKEEFTFLNLPIRRCKEADIVEFEGKNLPRWRAETAIKVKEHNDKLDELLKSGYTHCHIIKRGNYYCDNMCGYTGIREKAGVYTIKEGVNHARNILELHISPIKIEEHNKRINEEIDKLKKRLI